MSMVHLTCSVGLGGVNLPTDLHEVRFLLDMHIFGDSRFREHCANAGLLAADGFSLMPDPDPSSAAITGSAVVQFQNKTMFWTLERCDGRVDPRGKTWTALTGAVGPGNINPVDSGPVMNPIRDALGNAGFKAYNQGAYTSEKLGYQRDGNDVTIAQEGCFLCVLTMAATGIGRPTSSWPKGLLAKDLTPIHANKIAKDNNCYSSEGLNPFSLVPLLGMSIERFGAGRWDKPLPANPTDHAEGHIAAGGVVAAHVDYKDKHSDKSLGDHWVLVTNKASGSGLHHFDAIDPSGGVWMGMSKNSAACMRDTDLLTDWLADPSKEYHRAYLYGLPSPNSSTQRQAYQSNYRMVRYCLLSPC